MDRRDDEMPRQSSLDRYLDRLMISDLSDHDDIRVLSEGGTESRSKIITDRRKHLALIDSVDLIFYWIFESHDIDIWSIKLRET